MKEQAMEIKWRTVQFFIGYEGVSEVEANALEPNQLRCTCSRFTLRNKCKHTKFVEEKMDENNGHYSIKISHEVSDEDAIAAVGNPDTFREFIIKYATAEVID